METMAGCAFPSQRACSLFTLACWCQVPCRGEEEACLLFYGGNTDEPFKILRNIYFFNVSAFVIYPSDCC